MNVRLALDDTTIYATEYTLFQDHNTIHEIEINEGYMDINLDPFIEKRLKAERERVWEMARRVYSTVTRGGLSSKNMYECFGTPLLSHTFGMDVDTALEKYESWKKTHDVEEVIKSLKPQDVVAVPKLYERDSYCVYMVTMVNPYFEGDTCIIRGIDCTGDVILNRRTFEECKGLEKIGRVVETTDILGEIKKIEDEWRKNR